jgi:hypothetical protein
MAIAMKFSAPSIQRVRYGFVKVGLVAALAVPGVASARETGADDYYMIWDCHIEETLKEGTIRASRTYDDEGELFSGDFFHWNSKGYDPSRPSSPLEWDIGYIGDTNRPLEYDDRKAEVNIRVRLKSAEVPYAALLEIKRPFPVEPHGMIGSTALTTLVFGGRAHDPASGNGDLPLGDLLSYAGPFEELDWKLTTVHNQYGQVTTLAGGKVNVAAFKEASAAIPRLKIGLQKLAEDFRRNCEFVERLKPPVVY